MSGSVGTKTTAEKSVSQAAGLAPTRENRLKRFGVHGDMVALQRATGNQAVSSQLHPTPNELPAAEKQVPPVVKQVLENNNSQSLDASTRAFMEVRLGNSLGHVRLHTDNESAESARAIGARAYTVGSHVVFSDGAFSPDTASGQRLLAHELTHVVQQSKNPPSSNASPFNRVGEPSEQEADRNAERVLSGSPTVGPEIATAPGGLVQGLWDEIKDAWKHTKSWWAKLREKPGEKPKEKEGEDWAEPSEEVALHSKEFLEASKFLAERASKSLKDDPEAAEQMVHLAEGFEEASKLVETGEKGFNVIKKSVEIKGELSELKNAVDELNKISDLRAEPEKSARAFDELFGATGKLAERLPDGPWQGYFKLLEHFKDNGGFFLNMTRALGKHAREADRVAEDKPPVEPTLEQPKPSTPLKSLEDVGRDVEKKYQRAQEMHVVARGGEEDYESFKLVLEKLISAQKIAEGNFMQRTFPKFHKVSPEVAEAVQAAAKEAYDALLPLDISLNQNPDSPSDLSLGPDFDFIKKLTAE